MNLEEVRSVAAKGKYVNFVLIGVTLLALIGMYAANFINSYRFYRMFSTYYFGASVVLVGVAGFVFFKMRALNINGALLMGGAAVVSVIFSFMGEIYGIIILVLCGVSLRQIDQSVTEAELASFPKKSEAPATFASDVEEQEPPKEI
jgi:hypothetical protein